MTPFRIRTFQPADAPRVAEIYYRSVHEVARSRYDAAQRERWAPSVPDAAEWLPYLIAFYTYLAVDEAGTAVAWIAMRSDGYIDMFFALPEACGRGAAGLLYDTVERIAIEIGLARMTAHASRFAEPFFRKRGWTVDRIDVDVRNDLPRAEMSKALGPTR